METAKPLTKRQQQVLDFLKEWMSSNSYPPTVREIADGLNLSSPSTVQAHLTQLEHKGYIRRGGSKSRSLELVEDYDAKPGQAPSGPLDGYAHDVVQLPLVGRVAAGQPILAEQNIEETIPLPVDLVGDSASFLLKVRGESMIEAGICDGDFVVVREQQTAINGDIVVALIDDGATVKAFYKEPDRIRLQPRNHTMDPIYTRDARILGKVVALFRTL